MAGIGELLGSLFANVAGAQDGTHVRIFNELKPWLGNLMKGATRKWLPRITEGVACEVPVIVEGKFSGRPCEHHAIAACDVCHRPVCLTHARIDQFADAICYICVADATRVVPPYQRERAEHYAGRKRPAGGERAHGAPPPAQKPGPSPAEIAHAMKLLGVRPSSTWAEVQAAHRKLSGKYHPDKARGARARAQAEAKYIEVQKAFTLLKTKYPEAA